MEGQHRRIRRFAVGPVYPNKSPTMCSSDFVFRKYKQHSAFRVSGVFQLAKTGPLLMKNFPLHRLFPSDAMMSIGAFCLPMLRRKYFDVSNRWYAPALRIRKSQNGGKYGVGFDKFFGDGSSLFLFHFATCVKESENQPNGFVESHRKSQPSPFQVKA